MRMTDKQFKLLRCLQEANPDGTVLDLDQLIDNLEKNHGWETSKPSIQFSLRSLIREGLVEKCGTEKRRNRRRVLLRITDLGRQVV
jgi:DNA-binding MarR family transcriptional regulator